MQSPEHTLVNEVAKIRNLCVCKDLKEKLREVGNSWCEIHAWREPRVQRNLCEILGVPWQKESILNINLKYPQHHLKQPAVFNDNHLIPVEHFLRGLKMSAAISQMFSF